LTNPEKQQLRPTTKDKNSPKERLTMCRKSTFSTKAMPAVLLIVPTIILAFACCAEFLDVTIDSAHNSVRLRGGHEVCVRAYPASVDARP